MPSISAEEHRKAQEFTTAINEVLAFVEQVVPFINENEYLTQMNNLKIINDNRTITQIVANLTSRVRNNELVEQERRRTALPVVRRKALTDAEKLASNKYVLCEKCDRLISKSYYSSHQQNNVCKTIKSTKKLTKSFNKITTRDEALLIARIKGWGAKTHRGCFYK